MGNKIDTTYSSSMNIVEGCLILTLPQEIDDEVFSELKNQLLNRIVGEKLIGVIIDFASIKIMDSYEFKEFMNLMKMVKLLGVDIVAVGLQPGLVSALIGMNVNTDELTTFLNLSSGLEYFKNKYSKPLTDEECVDGSEDELEENENDE